MNDTQRRNFGRVGEILEIPNLTQIQTSKYYLSTQCPGLDPTVLSAMDF